MKDLIQALTIFSKYTDTQRPTHCEHDTLMVVDIEFDQISPEDSAILNSLGFFWSDEDGAWESHRFGNA